jgi:hypothetical protein
MHFGEREAIHYPVVFKDFVNHHPRVLLGLSQLLDDEISILPCEICSLRRRL